MAADPPMDSGRRRLLVNAAGATVAAGATALLGGSILGGRPRLKGRKTVRLWHQLSAEWLEPVNRAVGRFNQSQGRYEVVPLLLTGTEADTKVLLSVAGGDPPDLVLVWSQITSAWAASNIIQPLDPFMTAEQRQRFLRDAYPVVARSGWDHGKLYGMTMGFDLFVVYYRLDHFRQAGLDPDWFPATLEEMTAIGEKMNRFDSSGTLTRVGHLPQTLQYYIPIFGGNLYDYATKRLTLYTPENLRALTYIVDTRKKLGLDRVLRFQSGLPTDSGASWPFIGGYYSMIVDGEWRVEQLRRYAPQIEYRTVPVPPPRGGKSLASFSMVNYLVIPSGAREPEGAWAFLEYWTGLEQPERAAEFFPWYGWMPVLRASENTAVYQDWLKTVPQYRTFLKVAKSDNIMTTPPVPYQTFLMDRLTSIDQLAMRGTLSPEQALRKFETDVAHELARRRALGYAE
jgi:multiple sugar transport system substrate-binding protein